ncbi:MAG TPA: VRR-NUC domain-containing protein [Methanosarcinales archaeon]|nr:VRR-NUC domain-containing protein [Methanosarcinales archaeon]
MKELPVPTEYEEQAAIFRLAQLYIHKYPSLRWLNGSLNGVRLTIGNAMKCKRIGMKKGFPDLNLPVRCGKYPGLYIELKRIKGSSIQPEQREWREFLLSQGYQHHFCKGSDEAWAAIVEYLEQESNL